jgi:hypothetical protein
VTGNGSSRRDRRAIVKAGRAPDLLRPVQFRRAGRLKRLFRHRSLCRHPLRGIADREVIAFRAHFEVALVKSDDRRAMADGHDRRLR